MTNRYESSLLRVATCILMDACRHFPGHRVDFDRDIARLNSLVDCRGLAIFTLDLPALGKHFDLCLSKGLYVRSYLPLARKRSPDSVIPRLFQGLLKEVFDDSGVVLDQPSCQAIFFLRQIYYFAKKFKMDCHPSKVYQAVEEFARIEDSLPGPSLDWDSESFDDRYLRFLHTKNYKCDYDDYASDENWKPNPQLLDTIQETADIVVSTLGHFDPMHYDPKHGPGVVSDLTRDDFKFSFPSWNKRLEGVFPYADLAFANYNMWVDEAKSGDWNETIPFSKLIAVPKTQKTPRLIAAEPVAHQYCQQAIWMFFRERVSSTYLCNYVRFNDQSYSRDAALSSSLDGSLATIDLSSASDRLTCRLVERLFSRNYSILRALRASRTPLLIQRLDKKVKSEFHLKKFATQGSACTFPVETICFLILTLACVLYTRNIKPSIVSLKELSLQGQVRIFGDDIIAPIDSVKCLYNVLGYFDLKVNEEKSFGTGNFRESCGLDAYRGEDITPAYYVRCCNPRKPETVISNVETSNNFYLKGLWVTANWIKETVGDRFIAVVSASSGLFGYKSFQGYHFTKLKWNDDYQKLTFLTRQLRAGKSREKVEHHGALLQYFLEKPDQDITWSSGRQLRPKLKLVLGRVYTEQLV